MVVSNAPWVAMVTWLDLAGKMLSKGEPGETDWITMFVICESRFSGLWYLGPTTGEQLPVFSGHKDEKHAHLEGVAFMLSKLAQRSLWNGIQCHHRLSWQGQLEGQTIHLLHPTLQQVTIRSSWRMVLYSSLKVYNTIRQVKIRDLNVNISPEK